MSIELNSKSESRNTKQIQNSNYQNTKRLLLLDGRFCFENSYFRHSILFRISDFVLRILVQKQGFSILHCAVVLTERQLPLKMRSAILRAQDASEGYSLKFCGLARNKQRAASIELTALSQLQFWQYSYNVLRLRSQLTSPAPVTA